MQGVPQLQLTVCVCRRQRVAAAASKASPFTKPAGPASQVRQGRTGQLLLCFSHTAGYSSCISAHPPTAASSSSVDCPAEQQGITLPSSYLQLDTPKDTRLPSSSAHLLPLGGLLCPPPPTVRPPPHLSLSQLADPWERAKDMLLQGTVCDGSITGFNKGGVLVELDNELKGEEDGCRAGDNKCVLGEGGRGVEFCG